MAATVFGWVMLGLAGLIAAGNFYLTFLREGLYRALGWEYRWQSVLPVVGTVPLVLAIGCLWRDSHAWVMLVAAAAILLIDTGGLAWLVYCLVWNARKKP